MDPRKYGYRPLKHMGMDPGKKWVQIPEKNTIFVKKKQCEIGKKSYSYFILIISSGMGLRDFKKYVR